MQINNKCHSAASVLKNIYILKKRIYIFFFIIIINKINIIIILFNNIYNKYEVQQEVRWLTGMFESPVKEEHHNPNQHNCNHSSNQYTCELEDKQDWWGNSMITWQHSYSTACL